MQAPQYEGWRNLSRHEESFNDVLYAHLKRTPWWFISLAIHGVLVLTLFTLDFGATGSASEPNLIGRFEETMPNLIEEPPPVLEETKPLEQKEQVDPDPAVTENRLDDKTQTDNDQPFEEVLGDEGISDAPLEGPSNNVAIGVGPSAGGAFPGRGGARNMQGGGGGTFARQSVEEGMEWLAHHQSPGGMWDADGYSSQCKGDVCTGAGAALYDPGVTGLALLALLGAGNTHKHGKYHENVAEGLKYLRQIQDPEGCFGPRTGRNFTYNHAIATMAMVEAYGMSGSPFLKQSAQRAIDFIHKAQNPYLAWRYGVRPGDNDTSVSGWMIMALKSAKLCELRVDPSAFDGMAAWLDKVTEPEYGRVGYTARGTGPARPQDRMEQFPASKSESLTAVGMLSRIFIGQNPKSDVIQKGVDLCLKNLPVWDPQGGAIDMYYWYYGTLAMFQVGGKPFEAWNDAMKSAIIDHQRHDGCAKGSWDPVGPWGGEGGRVYSTALMTMCMEVYYRYPRVPYTK